MDNKVNYQNLCIYELRVLAKSKGVKCPTKMKKQQIIECLIAIENGHLTPYYTNKGRPQTRRVLKSDNAREMSIDILSACKIKYIIDEEIDCLKRALYKRFNVM